ncbi:MAG: tail fiber domain-containing protein [Balneolaceae bacterium]
MLSKIMQLQPRKYQFLTNEVLTEQNLPTLNAKEGEHYGLIAQDLEQIFPELVVDVIHQLQNDEKASSETVTTKAINYQELTVVLLAVVQNLQAELEALKTKK